MELRNHRGFRDRIQGQLRAKVTLDVPKGFGSNAHVDQNRPSSHRRLDSYCDVSTLQDALVARALRRGRGLPAAPMRARLLVGYAQLGAFPAQIVVESLSDLDVKEDPQITTAKADQN